MQDTRAIVAALEAGDVEGLLELHRGIYGSTRMEDGGDGGADADDSGDTDSNDTDETDEDTDDEEDEEKAQTFTREYVEKLRRENAKYRSKAKEADQAAQELAQAKLKDASTDEKLADAEKRLAEAEARVTRRDAALDFNLTKEDVSFLDFLVDEEQIQALAKRLAQGNKKGSRSADSGSDDEDTGSTRRVGVKGSTNGNRSGTASGGSREALGRALFGV